MHFRRSFYNNKSTYALHMLQCRHEYGKIEETMDILKVM
jgi:hypothetical protein